MEKGIDLLNENKNSVCVLQVASSAFDELCAYN